MFFPWPLAIDSRCVYWGGSLPAISVSCSKEKKKEKRQSQIYPKNFFILSLFLIGCVDSGGITALQFGKEITFRLSEEPHAKYINQTNKIV